jgi:hypothetical protein
VSMSKKDYQAIARAIYEARTTDGTGPFDVVQHIQDGIARYAAADNPRFDRARFLEACETGSCKGMRKAAAKAGRVGGLYSPGDTHALSGPPLPPCVLAMQCYCAGHAGGLDASKPCDTREAR